MVKKDNSYVRGLRMAETGPVGLHEWDSYVVSVGGLVIGAMAGQDKLSDIKVRR